MKYNGVFITISIILIFTIIFFASEGTNNISYSQQESKTGSNITKEGYTIFQDSLLGVKFEYPSDWRLEQYRTQITLKTCKEVICGENIVIKPTALDKENKTLDQFTREYLQSEDRPLGNSLYYGDLKLIESNKTVLQTMGNDALELLLHSASVDEHLEDNYVYLTSALDPSNKNTGFIIYYVYDAQDHPANITKVRDIANSLESVGFG